MSYAKKTGPVFTLKYECFMFT
uniref:Uncharacterized protein n=1 Tax=Anguilla anguilla TaxID=7936 RepID=A0A0E9Q0Z9_ANGAN